MPSPSEKAGQRTVSSQGLWDGVAEGIDTSGRKTTVYDPIAALVRLSELAATTQSTIERELIAQDQGEQFGTQAPLMPFSIEKRSGAADMPMCRHGFLKEV